MSSTVEYDGDEAHLLEPPTDDQLRRRTEDLLKAAERVSLQLKLQTERLSEAISMFDTEIIIPLRQGLKD